MAVPLTNTVPDRNEAEVNTTYFTHDTRLLLHLPVGIAHLAVQSFIGILRLVLKLLSRRSRAETGVNLQKSWHKFYPECELVVPRVSLQFQYFRVASPVHLKKDGAVHNSDVDAVEE